MSNEKDESGKPPGSSFCQLFKFFALLGRFLYSSFSIKVIWYFPDFSVSLQLQKDGAHWH
jgi:hypothetical protein